MLVLQASTSYWFGFNSLAGWLQSLHTPALSQLMLFFLILKTPELKSLLGLAIFQSSNPKDMQSQDE